MRQRRTELHSESYEKKTVLELHKENTYGGPRKTEKGKMMPKVFSYKGITMKWKTGAGKYPYSISIQMTDDNWVEYLIAKNQPGFFPRTNEGVNMERGYPAESGDE